MSRDELLDELEALVRRLRAEWVGAPDRRTCVDRRVRDQSPRIPIGVLTASGRLRRLGFGRREGDIERAEIRLQKACEEANDDHR